MLSYTFSDPLARLDLFGNGMIIGYYLWSILIENALMIEYDEQNTKCKGEANLPLRILAESYINFRDVAEL